MAIGVRLEDRPDRNAPRQPLHGSQVVAESVEVDLRPGAIVPTHSDRVATAVCGCCKERAQSGRLETPPETGQHLLGEELVEGRHERGTQFDMLGDPGLEQDALGIAFLDRFADRLE